jgi:hypothetical protein
MKPMNHETEYMALICAQLRAEFPNATGEVIGYAAKAKKRPHVRFLKLIRGNVQ